MGRKNRRPKQNLQRERVATLYGKLKNIDSCYGYCKLHNCYLTKYNINVRGCRRTQCQHYKDTKCS